MYMCDVMIMMCVCACAQAV